MRSFISLVDCICAKIVFGRKVVFLGKTVKNWFVIIQNVKEKITDIIIVFVFFTEFTIPMSARQVLQSFCSLVEKYGN